MIGCQGALSVVIVAAIETRVVRCECLVVRLAVTVVSETCINLILLLQCYRHEATLCV